MLNTKKIILIFALAVILVLGTLISIYAYKIFKKPIVILPNKTELLYIHSGFTYGDVRKELIDNNLITDISIFDFIAKKKNYDNKVKAGRYELKNGMTANELVNMLISGNQKPVRVTFNNIRFLPKLAGIIGNKLEADSSDFMQLMNDEKYLNSVGYTKETAISIFIPNTYEFWWNTDARAFVARMIKEKDKFWNNERKVKAKSLGLSINEVSILASIVQEETNNKSEMSRIAGVYLNRLKIGMKLQADPTARFAYGDFTVKRINYDYLEIDSPYNTYKYTGLPPGPICMPESTTIDKVLNAEKHKYYYFCAKADNSGTHVFSTNHRQHINYANAYHRYLNRRKIRR
jgi:UPF0755 protein